MRIFCVGQGRTRVCGEAYSVYVAAGNPRRTPYNAKKTIYGWTLVCERRELRQNISIAEALKGCGAGAAGCRT